MVRAYRPEIDGLRAVAILAVVLNHAGMLRGGFVGVDVFFVISGYLITGILQSELAAGTFSILKFYGRRIRRIFPALLVVLAACLIFGWFVLLPNEYAQLGKHIGGASLFVSNFVLWKEAGYFDNASATKPLLHLWSLGVEEQFYLIWPLLLAAAWALGRYVLGAVAALFVISLGADLFLSAPHPELSFFLPLCRFWELMAGGLLAWAESHRLGLKRGHDLIAAVGLLLIAASCALFSSADIFPGWRAMLPVAGAVMILASGERAFSNRLLLAARPMVWVGLISYPLYLWHWPLLSFARILASAEPSLTVRLGAMAAAVALAWLTYVYIESPVRRQAVTRRMIWALLGGLLLLGALGWGVMQARGLPHRPGIDPAVVADLSNTDAFHRTLTPCPLDYHAGDLSWCYLSSPGVPQVALFGDSHADHLFPGIVATDKARRWLLIGHSSCPPLVDIAEHQPGKPDHCVDKNRRAMADMLGTPSIHTVVLATLSTFYVGGRVSPQIAQDKPQIVESARADEQGMPRAELFYRGMDRTIGAIERTGRQVVFFIDVPEMDFWPQACIARPLTGSARAVCGVDRGKREESIAAYRAVVAELQKAHPRLLVYDPENSLCDAQLCRAGADGRLYYHDTHHLNARGSAVVARDFIPWLAGQQRQGDGQRGVERRTAAVAGDGGEQQ